jgi:hypothetical protein
MGFDTEKLANCAISENVLDLHKCLICLQLCEEAVRPLNCVSQQCLFCKECIRTAIVYNRRQCEEDVRRDARRAGPKMACPACTINMSGRKRGRQNQDIVVIEQFCFVRELRCDLFIAVLEFYCPFENCNEKVKCSLLAQHSKQCKHNICSDCGWQVGDPATHSCVNNLKQQLQKQAASKDSHFEAGYLKYYDKCKRLQSRTSSDVERYKHLIGSWARKTQHLASHVKLLAGHAVFAFTDEIRVAVCGYSATTGDNVQKFYVSTSNDCRLSFPYNQTLRLCNVKSPIIAPAEYRLEVPLHELASVAYFCQKKQAGCFQILVCQKPVANKHASQKPWLHPLDDKRSTHEHQLRTRALVVRLPAQHVPELYALIASKIVPPAQQLGSNNCKFEWLNHESFCAVKLQLFDSSLNEFLFH